MALNSEGPGWLLTTMSGAPSLAFSPCVVEAHKPVRVQTFSAELAIERFDESVVGRFARTREVQRNATVVGPEVEIARYELASLIDADRLGKSDLAAHLFENLDHIGTTEVEPRFDRG